jgi:hypothetical protein
LELLICFHGVTLAHGLVVKRYLLDDPPRSIIFKQWQLAGPG